MKAYQEAMILDKLARKPTEETTTAPLPKKSEKVCHSWVQGPRNGNTGTHKADTDINKSAASVSHS